LLKTILPAAMALGCSKLPVHAVSKETLHYDTFCMKITIWLGIEEAGLQLGKGSSAFPNASSGTLETMFYQQHTTTD
jgi:hypothetical protein